MSRSASIERNTSETKIKLSIDLDGNGNGNIHTGIGFFDHMLNAFARHGFLILMWKSKEIYMSTAIIRLKMSELYLEKRSNRRLEIKKGSNVMDQDMVHSSRCSVTSHLAIISRMRLFTGHGSSLQRLWT